MHLFHFHVSVALQTQVKTTVDSIDNYLILKMIPQKLSLIHLFYIACNLFDNQMYFHITDSLKKITSLPVLLQDLMTAAVTALPRLVLIPSPPKSPGINKGEKCAHLTRLVRYLRWQEL